MTKKEKEYLTMLVKGLREMNSSYDKEKLDINKIPEPFKYWPAEIDTLTGLLEEFIK